MWQTVVQYGALGVTDFVLLGCLIWIIKFVLVRLDVAIRENTTAQRDLKDALLSKDFISVDHAPRPR